MNRISEVRRFEALLYWKGEALFVGLSCLGTTMCFCPSGTCVSSYLKKMDSYIFWAHIIWRYINSSWTSLKFQVQFELTFSKPFVDWVILGQSESVWDFPLPFQWGILDSSRWKRHAPTECWHRNASQYPLDFQEKSLISRGILQQLICYVAECWTFNSWFDSDLIRTRQPFQLEEKRSNHYLQVDP